MKAIFTDEKRKIFWSSQSIEKLRVDDKFYFHFIGFWSIFLIFSNLLNSGRVKPF